MHLPCGFLASLGEGLEQILPIYVVQTDFLPTVSPAHHVIHGPGVLDAQLARHGATLRESSGLSREIEKIEAWPLFRIPTPRLVANEGEKGPDTMRFTSGYWLMIYALTKRHSVLTPTKYLKAFA